MRSDTSRDKKKKFENLSPTPQLAEGISYFKVLSSFFSKRVNNRPGGILPSVRTDLKNFSSEKPAITWFGHSSYLIHINGLNILVDPVFSGFASPFPFSIKAFKGSNVYTADKMPEIDWLVLTHNHYDHLDIGALRSLKSRVRNYVMPAGVSRELRSLRLGEGQQIRELSWWDDLELAPGIKITATPARHFSGRGLVRNQSLWTSYVLESKQYRIFIGGDSGFDSHFEVIGQKFGPFDIALMECGQYNSMWPYIHSMPEELIAEAKALKAKVVMPVHWGKFALAMHAWDEPVERFVAAAEEAGLKYTVPMIGEPVVLDENYPKSKWWRKLNDAGA